MASSPAGVVLPLIRTRDDLYRYRAATHHGGQMHEAIDILESALPTTDPAEVYSVTHKSLARKRARGAQTMQTWTDEELSRIGNAPHVAGRIAATGWHVAAVRDQLGRASR